MDIIKTIPENTEVYYEKSKKSKRKSWHPLNNLDYEVRN